MRGIERQRKDTKFSSPEYINYIIKYYINYTHGTTNEDPSSHKKPSKMK